MTSIAGINNSGTIFAQNIDNRVLTNSSVETKVAPIYMVEDKNIHFYGRDDKIEEINKAIEERKSETSSLRRTIILSGFGGMGKSETAKVFAEKFLETYDYVIWIDSQTEQSVEASFRELAGRMEVEFKSLEDLSKIQAKLTNTFKNGLFIFDNAERLETEDNQFGIENLLFKTFPKNKPIFLATSRNGSKHWGGLKSQTKIIHIDTLTDEEATRVLKNYLLIQNKEIPQSLEIAISSLVKTLGGYPLGLNLVGSTILGKTEEISFDETVSRIKVYTEMLKDVPLRDISGEFKYEAALELIYKQTTDKIIKHENGEIAMELLKIMACLNPDGLYLGLINAIYSGTTCSDIMLERVVMNPNVSKGFVILKDYSVVKMNGSSRLKIHRLIQQCVRKTQVSQEALSKILTFFVQNENNYYWDNHIEALMDMFITGVYVSKTENSLCLLLLLWRSHTIYRKYYLSKCKSHFNENSFQEPMLFKLAEICSSFENNRFVLSTNREFIENGVLNMPQDLTRRLWVIGALLKFLQECFKYQEELTPSRREKINSFIINCCMGFTTEKMGKLIPKPYNLLILIYGEKSTRNLSEDSAFLKKLFDCPPKELRNYWWENYLVNTL